jgi:hypothetical protein
MLSSFLGVLPILTPTLCALALSCDQSPIPLLCLPLIYCPHMRENIQFLVFWARLTSLRIMFSSSTHSVPPESHSFGHIPKSGIAGSYGRSMFRFLRSLQIFFQSGCTSLHSHQQCKRVPFPPVSSPTPVVSGVANEDTY